MRRESNALHFAIRTKLRTFSQLGPESDETMNGSGFSFGRARETSGNKYSAFGHSRRSVKITEQIAARRDAKNSETSKTLWN
jgi:hypothetical protein